MVENSFVFLQIFQSILDAERSGSSTEFFNLYFHAVRDFHPSLIRWKNQRLNQTNESFHPEARMIDLIQLRFESNQFHTLSGILDMIQEDVKRWVEQVVSNTASVSQTTHDTII